MCVQVYLQSRTSHIGPPVPTILLLYTIYIFGVPVDGFRKGRSMYSRNLYIFSFYCSYRGTQWGIWLKHYALTRKVLGSIPDGVTGIFHLHNPSGRTMTLGSTQPLTEMSTRNIFCALKAAGA